MSIQPKSPAVTETESADAEAIASLDATADAGGENNMSDNDENPAETAASSSSEKPDDGPLEQDSQAEEAATEGGSEPQLTADEPDQEDGGQPELSAAEPAGEDELEDGVEEAAAGELLDEVVDSAVGDAGSDEPLESAEIEDEDEVDDAEDAEEAEDELKMHWYILKVQVNREESIRDALQRRVKIEALDDFFGDIVVPTEDVAEFTKSGKRRVVKKKLYPGYIMVHMAINDDTWFLVRETPGIGDFTGSAGKPTPMDTGEVERILNIGGGVDEGATPVKTAIPYTPGDRVRVKEGHFLNFEGEVESVDEANGRVTLMINIFGRSTPVELEHWQIESV